MFINIFIKIYQTHGDYIHIHEPPNGPDQQEQVVAFMIIVSNTILNEHAMMIHFINAHLANRAMMGSLGFDPVLGNVV